jgi:GxxExxY protein
MADLKHCELTGEIINAAQTIHTQLGYGFLEKIYQNSLMIELRKRNIPFEEQKAYTVHYDGNIVGEFFADIVVDRKVIVELKAVEELNPLFEAQLLNYLKASGIEVGLLINFGHSLHFKRMVF